MKKRVLSLLLAVVMICSLLPVTASAAETSTTISGGSGMGAYSIALAVDKGSITDTQYESTYDAMWSTGEGTATITLSGVSDGDEVTVRATLSGQITGGQGKGKLDAESKTIKVGETGAFLIKNTSGPSIGKTHVTVNISLVAGADGGEEPDPGSGEDPEQPGEGGGEPTTGTELEFKNDGYQGVITIIKEDLSGGSITGLTIYETPYNANDVLKVVKATQNGKTIDIVLDKTCTANNASLLVAFSATFQQPFVTNSGNTCTLVDGRATMNVDVKRNGVISTYTVNVSIEGAEEAPATLDITTDLSETEKLYVKGASATPLTVKAELSKGEGEISYQWYVNTTKSTEGATAIADATSASYTPATTEYGTKYYYAVVTCGELTATSKIAKITVQEPFITFGTQPQSKEYTKGDTADVLTVAATQSEGAAVEYQWYSNAANNTTGGTAIEGETGTSYTPSAAAEGTTYYYAVATSLDKSGEKNLKLASGVAKITVKLPVVSFSGTTGGSALYLLNTEEDTTITVSASQNRGGEVSYQWYKNNTNSTTTGGTPIDEATSASYKPSVDAAGTSYYYVVASAEDSTPATSAVYKVTVREMDVEFTTDLSATANNVYQDTAFNLTVAAAATVPNALADGATVTYQWYKNTTATTEGGEAIVGATSATLTVDTNENGTYYYYVVATLDNGGSIYTATSSVATVKVNELPRLTVTDNVIDITDKRLATWSKYYVDVTNLKVEGAEIDYATELGTTINVVLRFSTLPDTQLNLTFGERKDVSIFGGGISDNTGTVSLVDGKATLVMTVKGNVSSNKGSATYTLNFSLGDPPAVPPTRVVESDNADVYAGFDVVFDLSEYFSNAAQYYLVEGEELTLLDSKIYTFNSSTGGTHTLVFAAANDNGFSDRVTVTIEVAEIKSGTWLGIETSNGSVNKVVFTDADGNLIEGLQASLDGTKIKVSIPRSFAANGKITASFDLTQNSSGYPKLSTNSSFNSTNDTKVYTTTLSSGTGKASMYLYNSKPGATNNSYTAYSIEYAIQNEVPVLADGQEASGTANITADKNYELDLDGIFVDPDEGDRITGWKVSVNGAAAVDAAVDENGVYSWNTKTAGEYTLTFYALDNYNAPSTETYTVTVTVANAEATYDVTVNVPDGVEPTFYYTANAQEGTTITAEKSGKVYTVKVPANVSVISWRYNGAGMSATVSDGCEALTLIRPVFTVKAGENVDKDATVTVAHASNLVGQDGDYLLLSGGGYTIKATPSEDYIAGWNVVELKNQTISEAEIELELVSRDVVITYPYFAELYVGESVSLQGVSSTEIQPSKITEPDYASDTKTASYTLTNNKVYEYRVSVPESNVNCDEYVTYAGTFVKTDDFSLTITEDMLKSGENGRTTIDRNTSNNRGNNVGDLYLNVNEKGYKSLSVGDEFHLIATRAWWGANADWLNTATSSSDHPYVNYYIVEPDFHYSVVGLDGQPSTGVIEIDENGNIKAVGAGAAIVLVTYDAMTMNHDPNTYRGAIEGYKTKANEFLGAIWPENTGAFVVSVGADASGITTGMTINPDKATGQKVVGKALDAELDVIYFIGEKGEYTFKPGTEGVTVSVANPTVSETAMSFTGFEAVSANEDGSFSVPLTEGRNIVRLEKDGKAEYQVITAKGVSVKVNGEPLENAAVTPGQNVKIEFDKLYAPVNRLAFYNSSAAAVYSKISGWDGKLAGNWRNSMGEYGFASYPAKQVVEHFVNTSTDGSSYGNSQVTTSDPLTVPADFEGEYFTLSGGAFNIGGFAKYMLGAHRDRLGKTAEGGYQMSDNLLCYLGCLPDISIPVATPAGISVTTQPTKTSYKIGDVFDPTGMVVTASYEDSEITRTITGYTYDTAAFTKAGEQTVTITYADLTATVTVTVEDVTLEKLEVTAQPTKTTYYIGDVFDPTGMVITAVYSDKSSCTITDYTYAPETITKDTKAITVTYGSETVDVPVSVSLVEQLEIVSQPTKTSYTAGERFDPAGMVIKAYYTDGTDVMLGSNDYIWEPASQLNASDTVVTVSYYGDEGADGLQPVTVNITVEAKESDGPNDKPEHKSIVAYMTFINRGSIEVQDVPVVVYDEEDDGIYRIGDAFRALHRDYYVGGESGYAETSGNGVSGWVSRFWGGSDSTFSYALNYRWARSTQDVIYDGAHIGAINGVDEDFYSDLFTWFDRSTCYAETGKDISFKVNGLNLMGSDAAHDALHAPVGATVKVYDSRGSILSDMNTTVGANGGFSLAFDKAGTYTVEVGGTAAWGSYSAAPVAPSRCTVYVSGSSVDNEDEEETATTLTPEVSVNASGEAKAEVSSSAVAGALEQAAKDGASALEIAPEIKGEASKVEVELPADALDKVADSGLGLNVSTPVADVKLPNKAVSELAESSGKLAVTASAAKDGSVTIDVSVGGKTAAEIDGGLKVSLPKVGEGQVMVIVGEDGTETIVTKHIAGEDAHQAILPGSATVKVIGNRKEFSDTKGHWGENAINFVTERNLYQGVGNGLFDANGTMTRAMLVTVLYRLEGKPVNSEKNAFSDVADGQWYTDAIAWANANKIVTGVGGTYFDPNAEVTREQIASVMYRYAKYLDMSTHQKGDLSQYEDDHATSDWAKDAKAWAVGAGLISGKPGNILDPGGDASRTEVASILQRLVKLMVK